MTNSEKYSYTWAADIQLPLESYRSRCEKFSFLNAEIYSYVWRNMRSMLSDSEKLPPVIQIVTEPRYMYKRIRYCPQCASEDFYHSVLHQSRFFDTCFIHQTIPLVVGDSIYESQSACIELNQYYQVERLFVGGPERNKIQSRCEEIIDAIKDLSFSLLDFNQQGSENDELPDALKKYLRIKYFGYAEKNATEEVRKLIDSSKCSLKEQSIVAIEELKERILLANKDDEDVIRIHLREMEKVNKLEIHDYCPLYVRSMIEATIQNTHDGDVKKYTNFCNSLICGQEKELNKTNEELLDLSKQLILFATLGSNQPTKYKKLWGSWTGEKNKWKMSFDALSRWYTKDIEAALFAIIKDTIDSGGQELSNRIQNGIEHLNDMVLVSENCIPRLIPLYVIAEAPWHISVCAFDLKHTQISKDRMNSDKGVHAIFFRCKMRAMQVMFKTQKYFASNSQNKSILQVMIKK